ncbi:MAG: MucR family transcriptional regulator [Rhizobiaceae bacterium]
MAKESSDQNDPVILEYTTDLVCAFLDKNPIPISDLQTVIENVHSTLLGLGSAGTSATVTSQKPPVSIKKSISHDHIICLEDGQKYKSLKRHLKSRYGMTPEEYRTKWGLPVDYPMVAPGYAEQRSKLAKKMGLGRRKEG